MLRPWSTRVARRSSLASSLLTTALAAACAGQARPSPTVGPSDAAATAGAPSGNSAAAGAGAASRFDIRFAALLDERAGALLTAAGPQLASLGARPERVAAIARVVWQTVAAEPVARLEAMAFLWPDGAVRWGVLAIEREPGAVEVTAGLSYPEGALAEGLRRPLTAAEGACNLPMSKLRQLATLPEIPRVDAFLHAYDRADSCTIARNAAGAPWGASFDWFGVILRAGDTMVFVTAPTKVAGPTITFGTPTVTPMPFGDRTPIVDPAGAPRCETGADCFEIGERAALTGEGDLTRASYGRACDLGHGLACIHRASSEPEPTKAVELRGRAVTAFRASCDRGDALDCAYLGIALETGQGVGKDEKAAATAYQRACEGGNALGCFNLGGLTREGRGLKKDAAAARRHYQRACELGDQGGCDAVDAMGALP